MQTKPCHTRGENGISQYKSERENVCRKKGKAKQSKARQSKAKVSNRQIKWKRKEREGRDRQGRSYEYGGKKEGSRAVPKVMGKKWEKRGRNTRALRAKGKTKSTLRWSSKKEAKKRPRSYTKSGAIGRERVSCREQKRTFKRGEKEN